MTVQQVNFYRPRFHPRRHFPSARAVLLLALLFLLAALAALPLLDRRLEAARQAAAGRGGPSSAALSALETANRCREEMLVALAGDPQQRPAGFAALLRGFSTASRPGVWLTGVRVTGQGREMTLRGRGLESPEEIAAYAQGLGERPAFAGRRLRFFQVSAGRDVRTEGAAPLEFCLDTRPPAAGAGQPQPGCAGLATPPVGGRAQP